MNRNLIFIDKIKEIKELKTNKTNLALLKYSKYTVLIPKEITSITNIIHIRPGTVIRPNNEINIHDFYFNKELDAHIIGSKYLPSDNVISNGLTIDPRRMNLSYNFKMFAGKAFPYADNFNENIVTDFQSFLIDKYHPTINYENKNNIFISKIFKKMTNDVDDIYNIFISKKYDNFYLDNGIDKNLEDWTDLENSKIRIREHLIGIPFEMFLDEKSNHLLILNGYLIKVKDVKEREKLGLKEKFQGMNDILKYIEKENPLDAKLYPKNTKIRGVIIGKNIMNNYYGMEKDYQLVIFSYKHSKFGSLYNLYTKNTALDEITNSHNITQKQKKTHIINSLINNENINDFLKEEIKFFTRNSILNRNVYGIIIDFILDETTIKSYSLLNNILFK